jgi:hypothetical protein
MQKLVILGFLPFHLFKWTWLLVPYGFTIVNSMGITASFLFFLYTHLYIRYFYGGSLGVNYSKL